MATKKMPPSAASVPTTRPSEGVVKTTPLTAWAKILDMGEEEAQETQETQETQEEVEEEGSWDQGVGSMVLLPKSWDGAVDLTGWWMSEELEGLRAYWDGQDFLNPSGEVLPAPDWLKESMPQTLHLDGVLWMGRNQPPLTLALARRGLSQVRYMVFDAPNAERGFEHRLGAARVRLAGNPYAEVVAHEMCSGLGCLQAYLKAVKQLGGSGAMLRQAGSLYERARSNTLLRVRPFYQGEALVVGLQHGRGRRHKELTLQCEALNFFDDTIYVRPGLRLNLGKGITEQVRADPPRVGTRIKYRFQGLTKSGYPRLPAFISVC